MGALYPLFAGIKRGAVKIMLLLGFPKTVSGDILEPLPEIAAPVDDSSKLVKEDTCSEWKTLSDLLDRLDDAFADLRKLKNHDRETYDLYSKIGGTVLPNDIGFETSLSAAWRKGHRPAFALVHIPNVNKYDDSDLSFFRTMYFRKIKSRVGVQQPSGDMYEVGGFFHDDDSYNGKMSIKKGALALFYVSVDENCKITPLKQKIPKNISSSYNNRHYRAHFTQWRWDYPWILYPSRNASPAVYKTPQDRAQFLFSIVASASEAANTGFQVRVTKGEITAMFCIDMLRSPYFFKDRDKSVTVNGKTKKIFHIVRTHKRELANGEILNVRSHFRGERKFTWNGYKVSITMPGLHHAELSRFDASAIDFPEDKKLPTGMLDNAELGSRLREAIA